MKMKRAVLLAGMSLAAIALAIPATASEFTLKDSGNEVEEIEFEQEGFWAPRFLGSGMNCPLDAKYKVDKQTVEVTQFDVDTKKCVGFGSMSGCEVTADAVKNLPWTVDVDATKLTITDLTQETTLKAKPGESCSIEGFTIYFPTLTALPDDPDDISSFSYKGKGKFTIKGSESEVEEENEEAGETGNVEESNNGTYEIG